MNAGRDLRVRDCLEHILQAIDRVQRYVAVEGEAGFLRDEKTQDAVIRNIEVIGEATRNVNRTDPAFAAAHPNIPWPVISGMRNRVAHGYFDVDLSVVWQTDLPVLEEQIRALIQSDETTLT